MRGLECSGEERDYCERVGWLFTLSSTGGDVSFSLREGIRVEINFV